jgi:hypothetical protein
MAQLTPTQEQAVAALLTAPDQSAAAASCGISRRTLTRWLATTEFREAYREASMRRLWNTIGWLRATSTEALASHVCVRAAVALLDLAVKVDNEELAARVAALEEHNRAMEDAARATHTRT